VIQMGEDNNEHPVVTHFTSNDSIGPAFTASLSGTDDFYELVYESFFDGIFRGAFFNEDYENERGYPEIFRYGNQSFTKTLFQNEILGGKAVLVFLPIGFCVNFL